MPLNIPVGFGSAFFEFTSAVGTSPFGFTLGFDLTAAGGDFVSAANQYFFAFESAMIDDISDQLTFTRVLLEIGEDGGGVGSVQSDFPAEPGGRTSDSIPISSSLLVDKRSGVLGRHGRGRFNVPGLITQVEVDLNGLIDPAHVATYQDQVNTFGTGCTHGTDGQPGPALETPPVILHSDPSIVPTPIAALVVQRKVGTLPRRLR